MTEYKKITRELLDSLPGKRIMLSERLCYGPAEDSDFECLPDSMEIADGELWFKGHEVISVSMGPAGYLEFDGFDVTLDDPDDLPGGLHTGGIKMKVRYRVTLEACLSFDVRGDSPADCLDRCTEELVRLEELPFGEALMLLKKNNPGNREPEFELNIDGSEAVEG